MSPFRHSTAAVNTSAKVRTLSWRQSLQFKLAAALVVAGLLLAVGGYWAGDKLIRSNLLADHSRYDQESTLRLAQQIQTDIDGVRSLASTLGALALHQGSSREQFAITGQNLVEQVRTDQLIVSAGVWPVPRVLDAQRDRASFYWLRDGNGRFQFRGEYNDPAAVSYLEESWFTPARYLPADTCLWSPVYRESLSQQEVVSCTMALRDSRGFLGAVTVNISAIRLAELFSRYAEGIQGYSLLVGRENRLLGLSDQAAVALGTNRPTNLVELAQRMPGFNPLALLMHQQNEAFVSQAVQSPLYDAATVSALKDATRDYSRQQAESALAFVWNGAGENTLRADRMRQIHFDADAIIDGPSSALILEMPLTRWRLIRVTSTRSGLEGIDFLFERTLIIVGLGILLAIIAVYAAVNWLVLRPLRRMTTDLEKAETADDALHLQFNENADNEIGVLSHWHNERVRQLRELTERTIATNSQLVVESDERRTAQEALAKAQERATLALQAVADGVIMTNERAIVEEINAMAEQLTGLGHRAARGRSFADVFRARLADGAGEDGPLPNLAELAISRGTRLEYPAGVLLQRDSQAEIEVYVSVTPIRTRLNRVIGAIVVFRTTTGAAEPRVEQQALDSITGLPNRVACDRALRLAIDGQRINPRAYALLMIDVDHLKRINDSAGQQAGDEVLARIGDSLLSKVGNAGEVFRMGADQFIVILANFDVERARVFAEAMREYVASTRVYWESQPINVSVSIGIAAITEETPSPVDVLTRAEDACAAAKRAGRNRTMVYDTSLDRAERSAEDAIWVRRIRAGLEQSLFHLTTQWIMPAQAHQSEGHVFEIQLALEDEEGFWASQGAFMAVAERHQLVAEMDRWVLRSTFEHLSRYPETIERLAFCAIHLSANTIVDAGLIEFLADQLQIHPDIPARKICFQIHESVLSEFPGQALTFCEAMRTLGVRVAVDQFAGRSASDIALIRKLALDFVKIDALQFRSLSSDPVEQMLAESTIRLTRALRKRVIVGNIADAGALEAWRRLGADYLQGVVVAKPSPVVFYTPGG